MMPQVQMENDNINFFGLLTYGFYFYRKLGNTGSFFKTLFGY